ncbi:MAG: hypothetical protein KAJ19_13860, partial [Gammaproteobacteria bacterium]|nr:hypothetical protein [Gammaproteobacteria bacterium]
TDYMDRYETKLVKAVRKIAPEFVIVSPDPGAGAGPYRYSRWKDLYDVVTFQLIPNYPFPYRENFGWNTKLMTDLTGVDEIWPCIHVESSGCAILTTEELRELLSQAFIGGLTGFHIYPTDWAQGNKNALDEFYGARSRWNYKNKVWRMMAEGKRIKTPKRTKIGLFYCEDTLGSTALYPRYIWDVMEQDHTAHTYMGPILGIWFKFFNEDQVEQKLVKLNDYDLIVVPYGWIERKSVAKKILEAVKGGTKLLIGDPGIFQFDIDGTALTEIRSELLPGIKLGERIPIRKLTHMLDESTGKMLPLASVTEVYDIMRPERDVQIILDSIPAYKIESTGGGEVLLRYQDGSPAALKYKVGKGDVVYFAFNPFSRMTVSHEAWHSFFRKIFQGLDIEMNNEIWDFALPEFPEEEVPGEEGFCLTGNHIAWKNSYPSQSKNIPVLGAYRYSVLPDSIEEAAPAKSWKMFTKGKLTNRIMDWPKVRDGGLKEFVVEWSNTEPAAVEIRFQQKVKIKSMVLYATGYIPPISMSVNGKTASCDEIGPVSWAQKITLRLDGPETANTVILNIGQRPEGKLFMLSELEVWGAIE